MIAEADDTMTKMAFGSFDPAADARLRVEFYMRPVQNEQKSQAEGRPIYEETEFVRVIIPGDRDSIVDQEVWPVHKARFADRYNRWKLGQSQAQEGTPLTALVGVTPALAKELEHFNISNVEQLANMSDQAGQQLRGFHQLKQKAIDFVAASKGDTGAVVKLRGELDDLKAQNEALQKQMQEFLASQKQAARK